jgi:hypothetical protein
MAIRARWPKMCVMNRGALGVQSPSIGCDACVVVMRPASGSQPATDLFRFSNSQAMAVEALGSRISLARLAPLAATAAAGTSRTGLAGDDVLPIGHVPPSSSLAARLAADRTRIASWLRSPSHCGNVICPHTLGLASCAVDRNRRSQPLARSQPRRPSQSAHRANIRRT